ncbi:MAG: hypothetical protein JXR84_29065, partial [Anaerolineae bacterium]|nr:hypothetical protein [Anaerolineae bacterium]
VRHLLDGVEARGGRGSGLPGGVLARLRETLLHFAPFANDADLCALFADQRINPWRNRIPDSTRTREARVNALIDALREQSTLYGDNALILFLHVLADNTDSTDALHAELLTLAADLDRAFLKS